MVMRETSGFSVRPTVRESMLKARRRNSEATRVRTPGLFSTYTTNVFSMDVLLVSSSFYDRARATDHFVQRRSGCDHRIHRVFLLNLEVTYYWPVMLSGRLDRRHDFRPLLHD